MQSLKPTHYVHWNGAAIFVKEAAFFEAQGGLTLPWGQSWRHVWATSIGDARRQAARMFGVTLSPIHSHEA